MASENSNHFSRLKFLIHPIALGMYLTMAFSAMSFLYYVNRDTQNLSGLLDIVHLADQKSIDYRLKFRGPRLGSEDVAILAFDDRSLSIVGRWPWPRQTVNQVFQNSINAGAKMIAADIVWSEPTDRPEVALVERLKSKGLPTAIQESLEKELNLLDGDNAFAEGLATYSDKFVLGNFFDNESRVNESDLGYGHTTLCEKIVLEQTPAYTMWDNDEAILGDADTGYVDFPEIIRSNYAEALIGLQDDIKSQAPTNLTPQQRFELDRKVQSEKLMFCRDNFLSPDSDPLYPGLSQNWATVRELDSSIQDASFDEWVANIKMDSKPNQILNVDSWTTNIPGLYSVGKYHGYFNAVLDKDGTIRRSQLVVRTSNMYMPSISFKAFLAANNYSAILNIAESDVWPGTKGLTDISINDDEGNELFKVPTRADGSLYINYAGKQKMFPYVSAADLVDPNQKTVTVFRRYYREDIDQWDEKEEQVDRDSFMKDKILVAGATAIGVYDLRLTPFEENFPGVETHANILDNLVRRDFLKTHPLEAGYMPFALIGLGLLLSFALARLGAISGLMFTIVSAIVILLIEKHLFFLEGYVVSIVFPLSLVFGSYVFLTFYKYFTEERSKKELRQTFSKYVSPAIVAEVLEDPKNLELGGRKENITVFFSDVKGFTSISEKLDPKALSDLLNDYLTPMTDLVFSNKGTLDKYIGDAVMAFFGAPIHFPDHAKYAARCALHQFEKLKELQEKYAKKGLPLIDIRIGLNSGECSVGNMGSETVRNYTVMGDAVNLASRLEAINKEYGTQTIISEFTHKEIKDDFYCREVDWVRVKGKLLPVKIFELIAEGQAPSHIDEMAKYFADGYSLYHEKRFDAATRAFEKALEANPDIN